MNEHLSNLETFALLIWDILRAVKVNLQGENIFLGIDIANCHKRELKSGADPRSAYPGMDNRALKFQNRLKTCIRSVLHTVQK